MSTGTITIKEQEYAHMEDKTFHEIFYQAWSERANQYDALFASVSIQAIGDILNSLEPLQEKRHLDVACGTGHLVAAASNQGAISEGIDFAPAMVAAARENYPSEHFRVADATDLPYEDASFDRVTCSFGLSHLDNPQAAVDEAFRVLKAGGRFAFTLWYGAEDGNEQQAIIKAALAKFATKDYLLPKKFTQLRYADEKACKVMTGQAGFESPVFKKLPIVLHARSAQEVVDHFFKCSLRTKLMIEQQPEAVQQQIYEHVLSEAEVCRSKGFISLAWPALLTVVQKAQSEGRMRESPQLETKHTLFDSIEEMLAPETLSKLSGNFIQDVRCHPMEKQGASGSQLMTVEAESNTGKVCYVLKRLSRSFDWMMVAGEDHVCRSVTLWQSGLLDQLQPEIDHTILACTRDGDGWAMLMSDVSESLIEASHYHSTQVYIAIEALTALHAAFWEHPALDDPVIGLNDISGMLKTFSPETARRYQNVSGLPDWWSDWIINSNALLLDMVAPDVADVLRDLKANPQSLINAFDFEPQTLLHGDYGLHNLGLNSNSDSKVFLFDWGLAGYGLPTVDLGWFLDIVVSRSELSPDAALNYYRQCLERRLGNRFHDDVWQRWQELGRLAHILRLGFVIASGSEDQEKAEERPIFKRVVDGYNKQVRAGLKWL